MIWGGAARRGGGYQPASPRPLGRCCDVGREWAACSTGSTMSTGTVRATDRGRKTDTAQLRRRVQLEEKNTHAKWKEFMQQAWTSGVQRNSQKFLCHRPKSPHFAPCQHGTSATTLQFLRLVLLLGTNCSTLVVAMLLTGGDKYASLVTDVVFVRLRQPQSISH
jgi:hypothetical protein